MKQYIYTRILYNKEILVSSNRFWEISKKLNINCHYSKIKKIVQSRSRRWSALAILIYNTYQECFWV